MNEAEHDGADQDSDPPRPASPDPSSATRGTEEAAVGDLLAERRGHVRQGQDQDEQAQVAAELLRAAGLSGPVSAREYRIARLRYGAHTLTFEECDVRQKRFALASTCLLADRLPATLRAPLCVSLGFVGSPPEGPLTKAPPGS